MKIIQAKNRSLKVRYFQLVTGHKLQLPYATFKYNSNEIELMQFVGDGGVSLVLVNVLTLSFW